MRRRVITALIVLLATSPAALLLPPASANGVNSLQSVLSPTGLSAYDTATSGSYFAVSETDFASATNNLASVTKLGAPDSDRVATCPSPWSANYITVISNEMVIPANAYVLGFAIKMAPGTTNAFTRLVTASSYKGTYDYLVNANYPNSVSGMNYYLFKEPVTTSSTRFVGQVSTGSMCKNNLSTPTGGYLQAISPPFSGTFSTQTLNTAFLQLLYTTVDQWAVPATISLSAAGAATSSTKGGSIGISTTQNKEGLVTFKANGKNIAKCISLQSSSMTVTCNWKPTNQGSVRITASLRSPTSAYAAVTSAPLQMSINKRITRR
jgi:hypothetical protein